MKCPRHHPSLVLFSVLLPTQGFFIRHPGKSWKPLFDNKGEHGDRNADQMAEIEAMGGDAFFLNKDDDDDQRIDTNNTEENDTADAGTASELLMASLQAGGGMANILGRQSPSETTTQLQKEPSNPLLDDRLAEIEDMGGDPSFLSDEPTIMPSQGEEDSSYYDEQMITEVEAMGGDPFFLPLQGKEEPQADHTREDDVSRQERMAELAAMGGDPFFLGGEDEDVPREEEADTKKEPEMSAASTDMLMAAMAAGDSGGVFGMLEEGATKKSSESTTASELVKPEEQDNYGERIDETTYEDRLSELEAMGGDPFFLVDDEEESTQDDNKEIFGEEEDTPVDASMASQLFQASLSAGGAMSGTLSEPTQQEKQKPRSATDGLGPSPSGFDIDSQREQERMDDPNWEWDGIVNENAHMDL